MATVENTIERQNQLYGVIARSVENTKKLGAKYNRGNVRSRLESLKSNWIKFQTNHESLFRSCSGEQREIPYFKTDLYAICEEAFMDAHGAMLEMLDEFTTQADQDKTKLDIATLSLRCTLSPTTHHRCAKIFRRILSMEPLS